MNCYILMFATLRRIFFIVFDMLISNCYPHQKNMKQSYEREIVSKVPIEFYFKTRNRRIWAGSKGQSYCFNNTWIQSADETCAVLTSVYLLSQLYSTKQYKQKWGSHVFTWFRHSDHKIHIIIRFWVICLYTRIALYMILWSHIEEIIHV